MFRPSFAFSIPLLAVGLLMSPLAPSAAPEAVAAEAAPQKRAAPTPQEVAWAFSDDEIIDGFMRTVFGSEGPEATVEVNAQVHKFVGPINVRIVSQSRFDDRRAFVVKFIDTLRRTVPNLPIRVTKSADKANMTIYLVDRSQYQPMVKAIVGERPDASFMEENNCSALASGEYSGVINKAIVFIVVNEGYRAFRHCMVEEITQSLGPVNDSSELPYSIYNDYSDVDGFGIFDWFIVTTLYDKRIKPGMSAKAAMEVLPAAIADARKKLYKLVERKIIPPGGVRAPQ